MTIPAGTRRMPPYAGDGSTTDFAVTFYVPTTDSITVIEVDDVTDAQTVKVLDTDYTIDNLGVEAGSTVSFLVAPAAGKSIYIIGDMPLTQPADFKNQSSYQGIKHEKGLDRAAIHVQEIANKIMAVTDLVTLNLDAEGRDILNVGVLSSAGLLVGGSEVSPNPDYELDAGTTPGTEVVKVFGKLDQFGLVSDFGADPEGVADSAAAIAAAVSALERPTFGRGVYRIATNTFVNNVVFLPEARVYVEPGVTFTVNGNIWAPRRYIFQGPGDILLDNEGSHHVFVEWFGAFPNQPLVDSAPLLQKLSDSVVAGRECVVEVGAGTWYLGGPVNWSRACRVLGVGERITHFRCNSSFTSGDVFTTQDQGVVFENIQFSSVSIRSSGRYIALLHNYCRARNIWYTDGFIGVEAVSGANDCEIYRVQAFTNSSAAGSAVVSLKTGNFRTRVSKIKMIESAGPNKPEHIVRIEGAQDFHVNDVNGLGAGIAGVGIINSSGTCAGGQIDNIEILGNAQHAILINTTGTGGVDGLQVGKVRAKGLTGHAVKIQKDGTGILKYVEFEQVDATSCAGALVVNATSGSVDHWKVKGGFSRSGTGNGYDIANADYWTITNTQAVSNTGTGTIIAAGCAAFIYSQNHNLFNTAANLTDNSGAVTKVVADNI